MRACYVIKYTVCGRVVELADTLALGANARESLRVQVPPRPLDNQYMSMLY